MSLQEKCRQIEQCKKMMVNERHIQGHYRNYRVLQCKMWTGSLGNVVTEAKAVKEIWQKYTEGLYRRDPNVNDNFVDIGYEDKPEV